ncbi:MAG: hypothetical protein AAGF31_06710 [Planctomycetota bacterium]
MDQSHNGHRRLHGWIAGTLLLGCTALTGCQIDVAGQTLPSPYYLTDDVQYYAPGPEFKLAREAAALKEQSEAIDSTGQRDCCP